MADEPTPAGAVLELWRFPVKSMQGARVDELVLGPGGAAGDRQWALLDVQAHKVLTAKRWGALLLASARIEPAASRGAPDIVVITLPDGSEHVAGDPATDGALSSWLDREVVLTPPLDHEVPYELTMDPTDDGSETWDWATPANSLVDLAAAHLLTDASLATAAALHPEGDWDVRRFRPTALVHAEGDGYVEDAWIGRKVALGGAVLEPFMPTPRCAMPTRPQPGGLGRDTAVSRTLTDDHANNFGVYAHVVTAGRVRVGDEVALA